MATETPSSPDTSKLEEVRREVVEARNMTIKTDNALKSLHAELKVVSQTQLDFQRRTWFSTGVAYIAFAALCGAGAFALSTVKASSVTAEKERLDKQVADLTAAAEKQRADAAALANVERQVTDVYRLMTTLQGEERFKALDALAKLDQAKLSPLQRQVLHDRATLLRKDIGAATLERGKSAFRKQDWAETLEQLNRFLTMSPADDDAIEASYYLGNASLQARKFDDAVKHLSRYTEGDKRAKNRDFALLMLSQAHDAVGNRDRGTEVARDALTTYPASEFRTYFVQRLQRATAAPAQPAQPAPAPAPTQPPSPTTPNKPGPTGTGPR